MRFATFALCLALAAPAAAQTKQDYPGVTNFTRVDATVACGGATEVATLDALKKDGFKAVINLRMANEPGVPWGEGIFSPLLPKLVGLLAALYPPEPTSRRRS